jgi:hypothetical protein
MKHVVLCPDPCLAFSEKQQNLNFKSNREGRAHVPVGNELWTDIRTLRENEALFSPNKGIEKKPGTYLQAPVFRKKGMHDSLPPSQ